MLTEGWRGQEGVNHVAISEQVDCEAGDLPNGMTVFWWKDRPVGHFVVRSGTPPASRACIDENSLARIAAEEQAKRRSANMTECVPVPSSEHVAEIVGRQGRVFIHCTCALIFR